MRKRRVLTDEELLRILQLSDQGLSQHQIGREIGVSQTAVWQVLKEARDADGLIQ